MAGVTSCARAALLPLRSPRRRRPAASTGRVVVTAAVSTPLRSAAYATRRVERRQPVSGSELANVVVFVQDPPRVGTLTTTQAAHRAGGRKLLAAGRRHHARIDGRFSQRRPVLPRRVLALARGHVRPRELPARFEPIADVSARRAW